MSKEKKITIDEAMMLEEIRTLLNLSIEDFVYQMDWPNAKYYHFIKNGRRRPRATQKQKSHPTIYKIFTGINVAISQYPHWNQKSVEITAIVLKHLLPVIKHY